MNLDKFLNKKETQMEFELEGKKYVADVSTLALLKLSSIQQGTMFEMVLQTFDIVFGEVATKELVDKLSMAGLLEIQAEINKAFDLDNQQEGK